MKVLKEFRVHVKFGYLLVRLEDWSDDYSCFEYGDTISVYTKIAGLRAIRAEKVFSSTQEAEEYYSKLENSKPTNAIYGCFYGANKWCKLDIDDDCNVKILTANNL